MALNYNGMIYDVWFLWLACGGSKGLPLTWKESSVASLGVSTNHLHPLIVWSVTYRGRETGWWQTHANMSDDMLNQEDTKLTKRDSDCISTSVIWVEQLGWERKGKGTKGRAAEGRTRIKEEGRVTFLYIYFLGDLESSGSGFGDAAFSTLDHGRKKLERGKKEGGEKKGGTRDGMDLREGRTCAVQFHPPQSPVGTL